MSNEEGASGPLLLARVLTMLLERQTLTDADLEGAKDALEWDAAQQGPAAAVARAAAHVIAGILEARAAVASDARLRVRPKLRIVTDETSSKE